MRKKVRNFFIAFFDDLGNFKHFKPYLFFRTFDFYTFQRIFLKLMLHTRLNPKSFLKFPGQALSEYIVFSSGEVIFANLDVREVWGIHSEGMFE